MYNHIDLLIIDEAGQVSPEIAACSFGLAKKALIVGDVHQIEPVWGMSSRILDISLANAKVIMDYSQLEDKGLTTNNSNVMKVASNSCYYEKFHQRGLFLSDHRRCYNEIIGYCNDLVYNGQLIPLRGSGVDNSPECLSSWSHMGYFNIETDASSKTGTSRVNKKEAIEIVEWLLYNLPNIKSLS
ncbi:hypothetical protein AZF37_02905 [endosymbiont 'TC1' of Trimyema compressum]|uniref:hypothetical protein n=1 Tax=endosymbiont 'TC1' of Trimyema compressum TaxID=243899 RepID=UPI0007F10307|nr:hypothetical protein [endosymbiont 'TC1' of Trimyema compressum]AMP20261.1 hypothetical protein AZF37_02905 [endosymbiont 'TC1' of Trimyema compressum]